MWLSLSIQMPSRLVRMKWVLKDFRFLISTSGNQRNSRMDGLTADSSRSPEVPFLGGSR